jgi:hypothetical protein
LCLSGHAYVLGRKQDSIPELDCDSWNGMINREEWNAFEEKWGTRLTDYDCFVATYPPMFGMLYKNLGRPILIDIPIRYDHGAYMHDQTDQLRKYIDFLNTDSVYLVANNRFDQEYCHHFTGRRPIHIPNLCEYTEAKYSGVRKEVVYYATKHIDELDGRKNTFLRREEHLHAGYKWQDVADFKAVVHIPYQVSTMSLFEHYTAGIPVFVPSIPFMMYLYQQEIALEHYSNNRLYRLEAASSIQPHSSSLHQHDPNEYDNLDSVQYWLQFADYYDSAWMPLIQQFDSWEDLDTKISEIDLGILSHRMHFDNYRRRVSIYDSWRKLLSCINERSFQIC